MRRTLQRFTALLALALLCLVTASAEDITVDNLKYTLNETDHTASVKGYVNGITTADIPQTVTSDGVEYKVTSVATDCFYKCSSLTSVTLPEGITSIGQYSFSKCSNLTSITIPEGVTSLGRYCFAESKRLSSVSLPKSLTSLGEDCFYYCSRLRSITIPEGVTKLEAQCFAMCLNLTSITLPHTITSIGNDCFNSVGINMTCYLYIDDKFDTKLLGTAGESSYSISNGTLVVPVQSIKLSSNELNIALGGTFDQVKATVVPAAANNKKISISSDNTSVVSIENGDSIVVKGLGETDIRYKAAGGSGVSAVCHVTVCPPADSVRTDVSQKDLFAGQTFRPTVTIYPAEAVQQFKASTSDPQVAAVDSTGTVTAVGPGEADIRYEAKDGTGKYAVCHVKVWPLTESLTPSSTTLTLKMGEAYDQQTVKILPEGAWPKLKMTSEDNSVATVDENGVIKAVGLGVTNIVYQAMDSSRVEATCQVRVILKDSDYYTINSKETWEKFCALIDGGYTTINAKMTADVALDSISPMAGAKQTYAGHFDGQGHTLTVNYIGTAQATAPFANAGGAVIENLKTTGTIKQTGTSGGYPQSHASGLVGKAFGVTINNCEVAVAISFTLTGKPDQHSGGFVGHGHGKVITMNNCKFSGSFTAPEGSQTSGIAGLVGWSAGTGSSFTNCYVAGTYKNIVDVHPLVYTYWKDNPTVSSSNNYYYFDGIGASTWSTYGTATAVTADSVRNGSVTYALQRGAEAKGWSQSLPEETEPMLAYSDAKTVNNVEFVYNDTVKFTRYANTGSTVPGGLPTLSAKDILGNAYNERHYYETSYTPEFTDATVVTGDSIIKMDLDDHEYFTVNSKATWEQFCALVNGGNNKLDAMMTADVTDAVTTMAGTSAIQYQGTFDGDGHTLNVNLSGGQNVAPFPVTNNATIENLRVTGTIAASGKYAAGLVGNVVNGLPTTISDCESNVTINSTVSGDGTHGGIVGATSKNGYVVISNCAFTGVMNGAETNSCSGFIGWAGTGAAQSSITNSLVTATFNTGTDGSYTFTRNPGQVVITNCYYLNAYGTAQGTQVTDEKLKNGYAASKLQADQEQSCWAFYLGGGTMLHAFYSDESAESQKYNYIYWNEYGSEWRCDHYHLTDSEPYQNSYVKFRADRITYLRSLRAGRCYTWCLPYTIAYSEDMPFKAYRLKGYSNGNAVFGQLGSGNLLYGYNPYLIVMKEDRDSIDYDEKTYVIPCPETLGVVEAGNITMKGTIKPLDNAAAVAANAYILQDDNRWHKVTTGNAAATIPAYRAYLTMSASASAKTIRMVLGDETTGISGVESGNSHSGAVYNLQGQKVADSLNDEVRRQLPTGVYIVNGKKVILK